MSGYFALTGENPEGCISCYCSGIGQTCESSSIVTNTVNITRNYARSGNSTKFFLHFQYETLDDWKITDVSRSFVMQPSRDNETGYMVFNMYEMPDSESVYWLAPDLYAGNKLQSYGADFVFTMQWVSISTIITEKMNEKTNSQNICRMWFVEIQVESQHMAQQ